MMIIKHECMHDEIGMYVTLIYLVVLQEILQTDLYVYYYNPLKMFYVVALLPVM